MKIGVLALQGDFHEHIEMLNEIGGVEPVRVKRTNDLRNIDALILPGGESTTVGRLMHTLGLSEELARLGLPIMGTCAGLILLASRVTDRVVGETGQYTLGLMNIEVVRNVFGRQSDSFITEIQVEGIGKVKGAFIRAPGIKNSWPPARVIAYLDHPSTGAVGVIAEQDNLLALSFHPEITGEKRIYEHFIEKAKK